MTVPPWHADAPPLRLAEVVGALSLATDLGMGQPLEFALCGCVLAMRLGEQLGLSDDELHTVYYQALLRYIGCNVETHTLATLIGDEQEIRREFAIVDNGDLAAVARLVFRAIGRHRRDASPLERVRALAHGLANFPGTMQAMFAGHCEVAQRLGQRLGFNHAIIRALGQLYERWDGKGLPNGLKGEAIVPAVRVVALAQDVVIFQRLSGLDAAVAVVRQRRGGAYDPHMADVLCAHAGQLCAGLADEPSWAAVLALEPGRRILLGDDEQTVACAAMADFVDIKSAYTLSHSSGVARLAAAAARHCGLPATDATNLLRAGYLHDLGRTGVATSIWDKPGALSAREWEQVRLHPYYSERVLAQSPALARLGALAALHHERLDGSGYHRGTTATSLPLAARILAAADVYHALTEARPQRPAMPPEQAAEIVRDEVRAGRLDSAAVEGVLAAAGQRSSATRRALPGGLSEREAEVLRLLARGQSIAQIAASLSIARKTADNHIQHIYAKLGVSTRAGATIFAMEHGLLGQF